MSFFACNDTLLDLLGSRRHQPCVGPAATIAQCPYTGPSEAVRPSLTLPFVELLGMAFLDVVRQYLGFAPVYVPQCAEPGEIGILTVPGFLQGLTSLQLEKEEYVYYRHHAYIRVLITGRSMVADGRIKFAPRYFSHILC